jgi:predicted DNA-binding transcriptional regulator AlpA
MTKPPDVSSLTGRHGAAAVSPVNPRGLSRVQAAGYIGVSPTLFDEMVRDGRMPKPKRINARVVWDKNRLDEAFDALPDDGAGNPWDSDVGGGNAGHHARRQRVDAA